MIIERFHARAANGETFEIVVDQEMVPAGTSGDPNATVPGLKSLRTSDGRMVNRISDTEFSVLGDPLVGEIRVQRIDP